MTIPDKTISTPKEAETFLNKYLTVLDHDLYNKVEDILLGLGLQFTIPSEIMIELEERLKAK